jgi:MFS transporter, FSR family, fosmidomycin resistance protein
MRKPSFALAQGFSAVGHFFIHFLTSTYFVIVLALEKEWGRPYHELIALWTVGSLLVGAGALPSGWLADRWSARGMMVVFFLGIGAASIFCGLTNGPLAMGLGLGAIGLFAAIYHPVGIAWLVRNAKTQGKALGFNGVFGAVGVSAASLATGALIDFVGWRAAFILPGAIAIAAGLAMLWCMQAGYLAEGFEVERRERPPSRAQMVRAVAILLASMFLSGIVFQATQAALPKHFEDRLGDWLGDGTFGVGAMVAIVYGVAGVVQYFGGHVADRYNLKLVYVGAFLLQVPLLAALAAATGMPLVVAATLSVLLGTGLLPAENMMLTRFTPERHRSFAFGVKYVVSFGTAPLALLLVARVTEGSGGLVWLWLLLAAIAAVIFLVTLGLPSGRREPTPVPVAAE